MNRIAAFARLAVVAALSACVAGCNSARARRNPLPLAVNVRPLSAAPAIASNVRFTDITDQAGLSFIQSHGGCGMRYFVEQVAAGAAVIDANGDGFPDLYFPQPKPIGVCKYPYPLKHRLFLNDGHGRFRLSPNAFGGIDTDYGISAAVGDYDNDGHPDLYVSCYGQNKLFHNRGDGTFEDVTQKAGVAVGGFSTGAVWFDYDGDGLLDLYVLRYCDWSLKNDIPCPAPDGKGRDVCNPRIYDPSTNKLFHNNGNGTFTDVTAKSGAAPEKRRSLSAAAVDFDGDGRLDLFVANDLGPNYLLHNNGDGTFSDQAMQQGVAFGITGGNQANMGLAVGDYNDSGRTSVCVTTFSKEPYTLYRNDGGFFTDVSAPTGVAQPTLPFLGFGAGFFDSRNIGRLDLFFANGHVSPYAGMKDRLPRYKERNQLLLNEGNAHFTENLTALPKNDVKVHRGACFADFDGDGRIDVLVTATNDNPTLLHNDSTNANWLFLDLTDKHGCCTPVGTRCVATINGRKLTRVVLGGGSYGGSSDYRVHFGLGKASAVEKLEVQWMSGAKQTLTNVPANQVIKLKEAH